MNKEEQSYLFLLQTILEKGANKEDRTNVGTKSIFGAQLRFSLENNQIPLLTTKKMSLRMIFEELMFFIRGQTNTKILEAKKVNIWKGNTSKEFLASRGLFYLPEGEMGKGYGFQWRNFGGTEEKKGVDQLSLAFDKILHDPNSRKILVSAWNPEQLAETALEPCHCLFQFDVTNGKLNCHWYQRSVDTFLGLPFNIASYALLTHFFAKAANLLPGDLIFSGGNVHLYKTHLAQAELQMSREPFAFPSLQINKSISSLEDIEKLEFTDLTLLDYKSHSAISGDMAI